MTANHLKHPKPSLGALQRVAVIDIGSNSLRLVVFDGAPRSPAYFFNEKVYCGLGADLEKTGKLSKEGKASALAVLRRFAFLIEELGGVDIVPVATAAVRDSKDGKSFCADILKETGFRVRVLSGEEEGRYAALGVLLGEHRAEGLVVDIGGASMELAQLTSKGVGKAVTTPLGPLRLAATGLNRKARRDYIKKTLRADFPGKKGEALHLVGGGWRALARLIMDAQDYPLHVLHSYEMMPEIVAAEIEKIAAADPSELALHGISKARAANAPLTAEVLEGLLRQHRPSSVIMSACGLREGLLYEALSPEMQASDPLIKASELLEAQNARFPGQGSALYDWLAPALPEMPARLLRSACLLADVSWHAHPDYRASACFTTATESSLLGLTHRERMMLAVALAYRYKGGRAVIEQQSGVSLLSKSDLETAEAAGKLIRLATMATSMSINLLQTLKLKRDAKKLTLKIPADLSAIVSPALELRLESAAEALGLAARFE